MHEHTNNLHRPLTRRAFTQRFLFGVLAGPVIAACGPAEPEPPLAATVAAGGGATNSSASCTDESGLSEREREVRRTLQYTDRSPNADKRCDNCEFFRAPASSEPCGGCTAVPGPIHPKGYCIAWKAA